MTLRAAFLLALLALHAAPAAAVTHQGQSVAAAREFLLKSESRLAHAEAVAVNDGIPETLAQV